MTRLDCIDPRMSILMTSKFLFSKCLWLRTRGFYRVRVSERDSGGCREREVRRRISATLIDRYLSPSPLAWKNTRSSMSTEINKRKPPDRSSPPLCFSRALLWPFHEISWSRRSPPPPLSHLAKANEGWVVENQDGEICSIMLSTDRPATGRSQGRLTESQQRIDERTTVSLTFSQMHQGVRGWHIPPLDAEVSGATSRASLSYLCQVTAREQSKEQWCSDHVSVIRPLRKVIETIYRNLDSPPAINISHNKQASP